MKLSGQTVKIIYYLQKKKSKYLLFINLEVRGQTNTKRTYVCEQLFVSNQIYYGNENAKCIYFEAPFYHN